MIHSFLCNEIITSRKFFLSLLRKSTFYEQQRQKYFHSNATLMDERSFLAGADIVDWHLLSVNLRLQSLRTYNTLSECLKFLRLTVKSIFSCFSLILTKLLRSFDETYCVDLSENLPGIKRTALYHTEPSKTNSIRYPNINI